MAQDRGIFLFEHDCEDFTTTGLVGELKPIEAVYTEEKNGISEVRIRLSYDEYNRWKAAQVGNYVKCEVPVRIPPVIDNDEYANTVNIGTP